MAWLKFIGLFTLSHGSNRNQQGGRVPLMWPAALCSGLAALSCGWAELWRNPPTLNYTPSGKKKYIVMNEKLPKCTCMPNVLVFLSQPERTYWSLTPQLETVIIEISTVQVLRSRANPRRLYGAIHLPSRNWTYSDTGFYSGQTSCLNMKVFTFAKDEDFSNTPANLSYDQKCWHFSDHTNFILTCNSGSLYKG